MQLQYGFSWPETPDEERDWRARMDENPLWVPLNRNILVVVRMRVERSWAAYIVAVPGLDHDEECHLWRDYGTRLAEAVARGIFPEFRLVPYAK